MRTERSRERAYGSKPFPAPDWRAPWVERSGGEPTFACLPNDSVHHQLDVHRFNFSDLPIWDRLFGTYKDADVFAEQCGFPNGNERFVGAMLAFEDVYARPPAKPPGSG